MEEATVSSEYNEKERTLCLFLTGEIDHHSASAVREDMDREIFFYRPLKVIAVMDKITFMDSSGLGLLLGRYRKCVELKSEFLIRSPSDEILRILSLAGADKLIKISPAAADEEKKNGETAADNAKNIEKKAERIEQKVRLKSVRRIGFSSGNGGKDKKTI